MCPVSSFFLFGLFSPLKLRVHSPPLFTGELYCMAIGGPASILFGEPPVVTIALSSLEMGHLPWAASPRRLFGAAQGKEEPLLVHRSACNLIPPDIFQCFHLPSTAWDRWGPGWACACCLLYRLSNNPLASSPLPDSHLWQSLELPISQRSARQTPKNQLVFSTLIIQLSLIYHLPFFFSPAPRHLLPHLLCPC